jgi:hypothetical protein
MAWTLSAGARDADATTPRIPYDGGGPWDPSACVDAMTPHLAMLRRIIVRAFPTIRPAAGLRARCQPMETSHGQQNNLHSIGRALDCMVPHVSGPEGEALANWCVETAASYGIQLVIWDRSVWQGSMRPGHRLQPYTGPVPHVDHVHVEVTRDPGPGLVVAMLLEELGQLPPVPPVQLPPVPPYDPLAPTDETQPQAPGELPQGGTSAGGAGGGSGVGAVLLLLLAAWAFGRRRR